MQHDVRMLDSSRILYGDGIHEPPVLGIAVVVYSGHLLLVRRLSKSGRAQWALPGRLVDAKEGILYSVLRRLKEETHIALSFSALLRGIVAQQIFENPGRNQVGREITHTYYLDFQSGRLPGINEANGANKARWIPLAEFFAMGSKIYGNHSEIVSSFRWLTKGNSLQKISLPKE